MKLPITKIRKLLKADRYEGISYIEVSIFDNDTGGTANMLMAPEGADIVDIAPLGRGGIVAVEDDGAGLAKIELRLHNRYGDITDYVEVVIFDGEPYMKLPGPLATELGRAVYLARKNKC